MKILIAGDFCPRERVAKIIEDGDYEKILGQVKTVVEQCDYGIVNLECPIRISTGAMVKKAGPSLKCSPKITRAIQYAGFECVTLANNHFYDQGEMGVRETIDALCEAGITYVGGGKDLNEACRTLFVKIGDEQLAIINCCEHEFSIATETTGGSNPLNPVKQFYAIKEAKRKACCVIVIAHGGIEHYQYPTKRMIETYRFFVDAGADAVINHHQHCFSGGEIWHGKPIFYGLGNFCFDWQEKNSKLWNEGYMVILEVDKDKVDFKLLPYTQNQNEPGVYLKTGVSYKEWLDRYRAITKVIEDKDKLEEKYQKLLSETERVYSTNITPYNSKLTLALYMRHLLPILMPKSKLRILLNMVMCESHYDRFVNMLKNYSK